MDIQSADKGPTAAREPEGKRKAWPLLPVLLLAGLAWLGIRPELSSHRALHWGLTALVMALFVSAAGKSFSDIWRMALIDSRNRMSLSRAQALLWTIAVLSAYFTAAVSNVGLGANEPLAVDIPRSLWILMGISATSLIGSPLLLGGQPSAPANARAQFSDEVMPAHIDTHPTPRQASWWDLVSGEEAVNNHAVDIYRVQMGLVTLTLLVLFVVALLERFSSPTAYVTSLPLLDNGLVTLFGISHTGYLAGKVVPRVMGTA